MGGAGSLVLGLLFYTDVLAAEVVGPTRIERVTSAV